MIAQTAEIQGRIEAELGFRHVLLWIEGVTGAPPAVALSAGIGFVMGVAAVVFLWRARKKRPPGGPA